MKHRPGIVLCYRFLFDIFGVDSPQNLAIVVTCVYATQLTNTNILIA